MKNLKLASVISCILAFALCLTACGSSAEVTESTESAASTQSVNADITAEDNASSASKASTDDVEPTAIQEIAKVEWLIEPTIEADNIDVMIQGEPNWDGESIHGDIDHGGMCKLYEYPLCAITKNGKVGIIKYDGTMFVDCDYGFYHVGNQAQLLVGDAIWPAGGTPAEHDMYLVTEEGVSDTKYYGQDVDSAIVYVPSPPVIVYADAWGLGTMGDGATVAAGNEEKAMTCSALLIDVSKMEEKSDEYSGTYYVPDYNRGDDWFEYFCPGIVPVYEGKRVGNDVYENVGAFSDGLFAVKKGGKWGYIDLDGNEVFACEYDSSWYLPAESIQEAYMSRQIIVDGETDTDYAYPATEGYLVLCRNGQYGMFTTDGVEVIPFGEYEALRPVNHGKLWAKQGGLWGVLGITGQVSEADEILAPAIPEMVTASDKGYIFPDSDRLYLTEDDLAGLDAATLRLARNEILARHGRKFDSADLQEYFNSCNWYLGLVAPDEFSFDVLNEVEIANIELIKKFE